jgi:hypothetical protein
MLENTFTTENGTEFDINFGRKESRRITANHHSHTLPTGEAVELEMTVSHQKGGVYSVNVNRHVRGEGFITTRTMKDHYYGNFMTEGGRYSAKNLETVAERFFEERTATEISTTSMTDWAKEITEAF